MTARRLSERMGDILRRARAWVLRFSTLTASENTTCNGTQTLRKPERANARRPAGVLDDGAARCRPVPAARAPQPIGSLPQSAHAGVRLLRRA